MNLTQRIVSLFLSFTIIFSVFFCFPVFTQAEETPTYIAGDYTYTLTGDEATITAYSGTDTTVTIPKARGGYPVVAIDDSAFYKNTTVIDIVLHEGIRVIGNNAFSGCSSLSTVTNGTGLTTIGEYAFYNCSVLGEFEIPATLTNIGTGAFRYCNSLKKIEVDVDNSTYTSVDGVLFDKDIKTLIAYPNLKGESYSIPQGVETISSHAFEKCLNLTSVTIPAA